MLCDNVISLGDIYQNYDVKIFESEGGESSSAPTSAIHSHMHKYDAFDGMNGFGRMQDCRRALQALDRRGWDRSYHQKLFHDQYIRACSRIFFKTDGEGKKLHSPT
eukprot:561911-Rhodomonas_salina.5